MDSPTPRPHELGSAGWGKGGKAQRPEHLCRCPGRFGVSQNYTGRLPVITRQAITMTAMISRMTATLFSAAMTPVKPSSASTRRMIPSNRMMSTFLSR